MSQPSPFQTKDSSVDSRAGKGLRIEEIRGRANFPDDQCLADFIQWCMYHPRDANSYPYWGSVSPSRRDLEILTPAGGAALHQQLIKLIQSRLCIFQSPYREQPADHRPLVEAVVSYRQQLTAKAASLQQRVAEGAYPDKNDPLFNLGGLMVGIEGLEHDLLANSREVVDGWLPNFNIRSPNSVDYISAEALNQYYFWRRDSEKHTIKSENHRIYLNPDPGRALEIAGRLIDYAEDADEPLALRMKIYNRALEVSRQRLPSIRSEGIVIYTHEEHTDDVLQAVQLCYDEQYSAFARRPATKLAVPVAEGVAVASNDGLGGEGLSSQSSSFLSHRAHLFDEAWKILKCYREAHYATTVTPQELATFKQCLASILGEHSVSAHNIAFPSRGSSGFQRGIQQQFSSVVI